jgi:hypothetical protein
MSSRIAPELGHEADESILHGRHLESLDDITREIADRRLHADFSESISGDKAEILRNIPDHIEDPEAFSKAAKDAGVEDTKGILGWSTDLETSAHILRGEVPREVATLVHEDLHRLTHPETLSETAGDPVLRELYEGVTEYLTQHAVEDLHGRQPHEAYPEQTAVAAELAGEVGDEAIKAWYFRHEVSDELRQALSRLQGETCA